MKTVHTPFNTPKHLSIVYIVHRKCASTKDIFGNKNNKDAMGVGKG